MNRNDPHNKTLNEEKICSEQVIKDVKGSFRRVEEDST